MHGYKLTITKVTFEYTFFYSDNKKDKVLIDAALYLELNYKVTIERI